MKTVLALLLTALLVGCVSHSKHSGAELKQGMTRAEVHSAWGVPTRAEGIAKEYWERGNSVLEVSYNSEGCVVDYHWKSKTTY